MGFAAGIEYRDNEGRFDADPIAARGETAGIPSGSTIGEFNVTEIFGELNIPLLADLPAAKSLEASVAVRYLITARPVPKQPTKLACYGKSMTPSRYAAPFYWLPSPRYW